MIKISINTSENGPAFPGKKLNIELDPNTNKVIEIISKMLSWTPERLLAELIHRDLIWFKLKLIDEDSLEYFKQLFDHSEIKQELTTALEEF